MIASTGLPMVLNAASTPSDQALTSSGVARTRSWKDMCAISRCLSYSRRTPRMGSPRLPHFDQPWKRRVRHPQLRRARYSGYIPSMRAPWIATLFACLAACASHAATSMDGGTDTTDVAADAGDPDACDPFVWDGGGYDDASPIVTEVHQFLTNCRHNENTDLITWHGAIYPIHRTSASQVLTP